MKKIFAIALTISLICMIQSARAGGLPTKDLKQSINIPTPATRKAYDMAIQGYNMPAAKAERIERQLEKTPDNLTSQTLILGYLFRHSWNNKELRQNYRRHILWLIEHHPDSEIAGTPYAGMDPSKDMDSYNEGKQLWLKLAQQKSKNSMVLGNAAHYLLIYDAENAERLYKQAQALEPNNPEWPSRLAFLKSLEEKRKKMMAGMEEDDSSDQPVGKSGGKSKQIVIPHHIRNDSVMLALMGTELSGEQAARIEAQLQQAPDNLTSRTLILGYLEHHAFGSPKLRKAFQRHALWVIKNHPESGVAHDPCTHLDPIFDQESYFEGKQLWLKHVDRMSTNTTILGNAAEYFLLQEKEIAERLLKQAQKLEPRNPEWPDQLGHLYGLQTPYEKNPARHADLARKQLASYEKADSLPKPKDEKDDRLEDLAVAALEAGDDAKAERYARQLLKSVSDPKDDEYGKAIHKGNTILGRLALKHGDLAMAKSCLLKSGKVPGSGSLDSFGPNMSLAAELLKRGQKDVVLQYFDLCAKFWKDEKLAQWRKQVQAGQAPDFGANMVY